MCMMCSRPAGGRARDRRFFATTFTHSVCMRASRVLWGYSPLRCDMCPFSASVHNSAESYFYLPLGGGHQTDAAGPDFTYWVRARAEILTRKIFLLCVCITYRHYLRARGEYFLLLGHIKPRALRALTLASGALVKKLKFHVRIKVGCEIWWETALFVALLSATASRRPSYFLPLFWWRFKGPNFLFQATALKSNQKLCACCMLSAPRGHALPWKWVWELIVSKTGIAVA
jgi:hypothetical protein